MANGEWNNAPNWGSECFINREYARRIAVKHANKIKERIECASRLPQEGITNYVEEWLMKEMKGYIENGFDDPLCIDCVGEYFGVGKVYLKYKELEVNTIAQMIDVFGEIHSDYWNPFAIAFGKEIMKRFEDWNYMESILLGDDDENVPNFYEWRLEQIEERKKQRGKIINFRFAKRANAGVGM